MPNDENSRLKNYALNLEGLCDEVAGRAQVGSHFENPTEAQFNKGLKEALTLLYETFPEIEPREPTDFERRRIMQRGPVSHSQKFLFYNDGNVAILSYSEQGNTVRVFRTLDEAL